jgi:hypothetical protein
MHARSEHATTTSSASSSFDTAELDKMLVELLTHESKGSTPTVGHRKVKRLTIDHPAAETYNRFALNQIKSLCESVPGSARDRIVPSLGHMPEGQLRHYRLWAYWAKRGADDPSWAAYSQAYWETLTEETIEDYKSIGFHVDRSAIPKCLRDLERLFLFEQTPNIRRIIQRCPQMAMIHALRGDVSEPYWWAALAITENATPNLSREFSDGYPKFSEDELAERVARIHSEKKRPALCDRIDSVNSNVCAVCRFRGSINSPIALGFEHEPKRKAIAP